MTGNALAQLHIGQEVKLHTYFQAVSYTHLDVYKRQGQMIAEAGGFVSAPVHASVSGTVKGIEKRLTATGSMVDSIIVENRCV